jgi:hypothetical protein
VEGSGRGLTECGKFMNNFSKESWEPGLPRNVAATADWPVAR